jgi:hypothetical protein
VDKRKEFLDLEDRKKKNRWTRLRNQATRMCFKRQQEVRHNSGSLVASSTEEGQWVRQLTTALSQEGHDTVSDLVELSSLLEEVRQQEDFVLEERKENEKIRKKVDAAMADIEGRTNFKDGLRETYDGPTTETMNEEQWRAKIDSKMYTVLVDKTKAMLVSKSTKNSHSQWEGSLDHDNFIVLQKNAAGASDRGLQPHDEQRGRSFEFCRSCRRRLGIVRCRGRGRRRQGRRQQFVVDSVAVPVQAGTNRRRVELVLGQ